MQDDDRRIILLLQNVSDPNGRSYSPVSRSALTQLRKHRASDTSLFPVDRYEGRMRKLMQRPQWIAAACDRVLKRSQGKWQARTLVNPRTFSNARVKLKGLP